MRSKIGGPCTGPPRGACLARVIVRDYYVVPNVVRARGHY